MPKLRKGDTPKSKRHIKRLAQQQITFDLKNIAAEFAAIHQRSTVTSHINNLLQDQKNVQDPNLVNASIKRDSLQDPKNIDQNLVTASVQDDILPNDTNAENRNSIETIHVNNPFLFHDKQLISESRDCEEFEDINCEDDDAGSIASSSIYRYSDSDAESIPDLDSNYNIDSFEEENPDDSLFDYLLKNPQSAQDEKFRREIEDWAKECKIPHRTLNLLLKILNAYTNTKFPKDSRTLLKTPKSTNVVDMGSGQYCHMGLINVVKKVIEKRSSLKHDFESVNLLINIDGAPLCRNSSEKGIWTILCKDANFSNVYPVGIYHGTTKPKDPNEFVQTFVDEAIPLLNNGFTHNCKTYEVKIHAFIFDGPAKSYILGTKYPTGYSSCSKCTIEGVYYNSVCFPLPDLESLQLYCNKHLRNDINFKDMEYTQDYQRESTVLTELPFVGLVSNVPVDSMHLVYLGVMRQLIRHWIGDKGRKNKRYRLSSAQIDKISERLENMKYILPSDFNRRSRSLTYWKLWKATEFRHFLLYFGPVVLKDVVSSDVYNNFLLFHVSISILTSAKLVAEIANIKYAESLIILFLNGFQNLYGKGNVTHNVHNLLHLAKDVQKYGPIKAFSAFPFENYIGSLKKLLRKSAKPLQQLSRRLAEYECSGDGKNIPYAKQNVFRLNKYHCNGIITTDRMYQSQFKVLSVNSWCINTGDERNNCVLLQDDTVVNVLNFAKSKNDIYIIGKRFITESDLYAFPGFSSRKLGVRIVFESNVLEVWTCNMIRAKIFKIPYKNKYLICPQIHTFLS